MKALISGGGIAGLAAAIAQRTRGIEVEILERGAGAHQVTLVGDAAHPMSPNAGMGACQALEGQQRHSEKVSYRACTSPGHSNSYERGVGAAPTGS